MIDFPEPTCSFPDFPMFSRSDIKIRRPPSTFEMHENTDFSLK